LYHQVTYIINVKKEQQRRCLFWTFKEGPLNCVKMLKLNENKGSTKVT